MERWGAYVLSARASEKEKMNVRRRHIERWVDMSLT